MEACQDITEWMLDPVEAREELKAIEATEIDLLVEALSSIEGE